EITLADAVAIQRDLDRLRELDDVLPLLTSACERKAGIHTAGAKIEIFVREEKTLTERLAGHDHRLEQSRQKLSLLQKRRGEDENRLSRGDQLRKKEQALQQEMDIAARERQQADGKAVEERTLLDRARVGLRDFQALKGAQVCRHCGQALTPGHYAEEKKRR